MTQPLDPMRQVFASQPVPAARNASGDPAAAGAPSFNQVLKDFVAQVDTAQKDFDHAIEAVERGDTDNLHQVMLAQNQAQLTLKLAAEVRNKVVEAYKEVMRTQF